MKINSYLGFALFLLLVSYTFAVEKSQQETVTQEAKGAKEVDKVDAYGGGGGNWGGGGGGHGGGGGNWGGGGGGGCRHGCCYGGRGGYCQRCCTSPEEAKSVAEQTKGAADVDKVEAYGGGGGGNWGGGGGGHGGGGGNWGGGGGGHGGGGGNWGGGGGGGCRHGCCYGGRGGYCQRCCTSPEEAKSVTEQTKGAADVEKVEAYGGGGGNWGGGGGGHGGGGCRHGCCYGGHGGYCQRCCATLEEAKAFAEKNLNL